MIKGKKKGKDRGKRKESSYEEEINILLREFNEKEDGL